MQEFVTISRDESATWQDPSLSKSDLKPGLYIVMFIFRSFSVADFMWITIQLHVSLWLKVVKLWPMLNIFRQAVAQSYSLITLCLLLLQTAHLCRSMWDLVFPPCCRYVGASYQLWWCNLVHWRVQGWRQVQTHRQVEGRSGRARKDPQRYPKLMCGLGHSLSERIELLWNPYLSKFASIHCACIHKRCKKALVCIIIHDTLACSQRSDQLYYVTGSYLAYIYIDHWYTHVFQPQIWCVILLWFVYKMLQISQTGSSRSPFSSLRPWKGREQTWPRVRMTETESINKWIQPADEYWHMRLHLNMMTWLMRLDIFKNHLAEEWGWGCPLGNKHGHEMAKMWPVHA